jgi:hypothetical protein
MIVEGTHAECGFATKWMHDEGRFILTVQFLSETQFGRFRKGCTSGEWLHCKHIVHLRGDSAMLAVIGHYLH